jgi:ABC-2 type transport system ATP-binding protein
MDHQLTVAGISKSIGASQLLQDVSFSLVPGEILGLIGPNGAGKTTLLETLAGLLTVDSGNILFNNQKISLAKRKQYLWYQPDDIFPYAQQRVGKTLNFFCQAFVQNTQRLDQLVRSLDLFSILQKRFQDLSKGYRRRVLLALALLTKQELLLLDEPFDGFDLRQTLQVIDLLQKYRTGRTLILSIHQLSEAERICDRFLLLVEGKVLALGTLAELCSYAHLPKTANLEDVFLAIT